MGFAYNPSTSGGGSGGASYDDSAIIARIDGQAETLVTVVGILDNKVNTSRLDGAQESILFEYAPLDSNAREDLPHTFSSFIGVTRNIYAEIPAGYTNIKVSNLLIVLTGANNVNQNIRTSITSEAIDSGGEVISSLEQEGVGQIEHQFDIVGNNFENVFSFEARLPTGTTRVKIIVQFTVDFDSSYSIRIDPVISEVFTPGTLDTVQKGSITYTHRNCPDPTEFYYVNDVFNTSFDTSIDLKDNCLFRIGQIYEILGDSVNLVFRDTPSDADIPTRGGQPERTYFSLSGKHKISVQVSSSDVAISNALSLFIKKVNTGNDDLILFSSSDAYVNIDIEDISFSELPDLHRAIIIPLFYHDFQLDDIYYILFTGGGAAETDYGFNGVLRIEGI